MNIDAALDAKRRIVFLDYLRGFACMLVVIGHVYLIGINDYHTIKVWLPYIDGPIFGPESPGLNPLNGITTRLILDYGISVGPLGVGIFFLISGFVITRAVDREGPIVFMARRFFRIVPVALTISFFTAGFTFIICHEHGVQSPDSIKDVIVTGFAAQGLLGTFSTIPVIWSLSVEIFFYGLMAALTACLGLVGRRVILLASLACAVFATLSHIRGALAALPSPLALPIDHLGYCAFHTCFLFVGSAIYRAAQAHWSRPAIATVCVALAIYFAALWGDHVLSGTGATGTTAGDAVTALTIFGSAMILGLRWRLLRPLRFFGDVSYPLYLLHIPLSWALMAWLARCGVPMNTATVIAIVLVIAASWVVHVTIERWSQKVGRRISDMLPRANFRTALESPRG